MIKNVTVDKTDQRAYLFTTGDLIENNVGDTFIGKVVSGTIVSEDALFYITNQGVAALECELFSKGAFWRDSARVRFDVNRFVDVNIVGVE